MLNIKCIFALALLAHEIDVQSIFLLWKSLGYHDIISL